MILKNKNVLINGQVITSRTETIEDYLKDKVKSLRVIGIANPYAPKGVANIRYYQEGKLLWQKPLRNIHFRKKFWYSQFMLITVFAVYFISILKAARSFHKKFDIFIGVACFSTLMGLLLRKLGIVRYIIYYSIDYYPMPQKFSFNTLVVKAFRIVDRLCVKNVDLVWHITPRIAEARERFSGLNRNSYKSIDVPLCYDKKLFSAKPFGEIERHTLGFVGTLSPNQGLQLVIRAMPELAKKIPDMKVRIIGSGIYEAELKRMIENSSVKEHFIFHGFIKKEKEMLDIISRTAIGLAPWTMSKEDNAQFADPGKPKLYAFCGLPTIITRSTAVADEIDNMKAGVTINYDVEEFVEAVAKLLKNEKLLEKYRENALRFAHKYTSDNIFSSAWEKTLSSIPD